LKKKAGGTDPLFQVGAGLFICRAVTQQIFIGVTNPEAGKKIPLDVRNPAISVSDEGRFGADDEVGAIGSESGARAWGEAGNSLGSRLDRVQGSGESGGDFGELSFAEKVEVVTNDLGFEGIFLSMRLELEKEGFGESSGGDSCGMERLNQSEG